MPARKKPAGTQQPRGAPARTTNLSLVDGEAWVPDPPRPQGGLLVSSVQAWNRFWLSVSAKAANEVDLVVAERWIVARDEWQRSMNAIRRKRLVEGSMGQPVLNPLTTWASSREAVMSKCEQQLGIGPRFRADLGISTGQAQLTAQQLNAMTEEDGEHDGDDAEVLDAEILEEFEAAT